MAKVTGALCSIAASGTVGGVLTFRTATHRCIASLPQRPALPPSAAQASCRLRAAWAASTWHAATTDERAKWLAVAAASQLPPFGLYLKEFCLQRSTLTTLPTVPAINQ